MYNVQGFILIKNFFTKKSVTALKQQMVLLFENLTNTKYNSDQDIINLYNNDFQLFLNWTNICHKTPQLHQLASSEMLVDQLKKIGLAQPIINTRPLLSFSCSSIAKHESYWKTPCHQDWPSTKGSLNGVTIWTPLVDVNTELGPLEIANNTHLQGSQKYRECAGGYAMDVDVDSFNYTSLPMNIGDIVIFNYFTVHRSGTNIFKDKIRWSTHFRYDDASEPTFIKRGYPIFQKEVRNNDCKLEEGFPSVQQINNLFV